MALIFLRERRDVAIPDDTAMPPAEDKVTTREITPRKDTLALHTSFADDYIAPHES
jgi:hypothetical protein